MSDEQVQQSKQTQQLPNAVDRKDAMLNALIHVAEQGLNFPVTLFVGGVTITGHVISLRQYTEEIAKMFRKGRHPDPKVRQFSELYANGITDAFNKAEPPEQKEGEPLPTYNHIHLGGASLFQNGRLIKLTGPWRGWIGSIDGFTQSVIDQP